jgi:hypothetical protein
MKKIATLIVFVAAAACSTQQDASSAQGFPGFRPDQRAFLSEADSEILIKALEGAGLQGEISAQASATDWSFDTLSCTRSTMELVAPGGGGFTTRQIETCFVQASLAAEAVALADADAPAIIKGLEASGLAGLPEGGALPSTTWKASKLGCSKSTMELVAPGGGGFTTRTVYSCVYER